MNPCKNCKASTLILGTIACCVDRMANALEDYKAEVYKEMFGERYKPKYNCTMADIVEMEERKEV